MSETSVLLVVSALVLALLGWLLLFAVAWVFPYAWRTIGLIGGLGWGLTPVVALLWPDWAVAPGAFRTFWFWTALPFDIVAGTLGAAPDTWLRALLVLGQAVALGMFSAWTGQFFRLFR